MKQKILKYVKASVEYGIAQEEGDAKKVNKNASIIRKLRVEMKKEPILFVEEMEKLLNHENDYVRLKSAFDLLPFLPEKAEKILTELSRNKGLIGFEAEMTIQEWKNGNIIFDVIE